MQNARACVSVHTTRARLLSTLHAATRAKPIALLVLIRENRNRLDMEGLREHIDRRCLQKLKAGCFESTLRRAPHVAEVAAHIRHAQGRRLAMEPIISFARPLRGGSTMSASSSPEFGQLTRRVAANNLDIDAFLLNGVAQIAHARGRPIPRHTHRRSASRAE